MNKSDLKNGMILTKRYGEQCILIGTDLFRNNFTLVDSLSDYNNDLTSVINKHSDIVKVFGYGKKGVIWERRTINWRDVEVGTKILVRDNPIDEWKEAVFLYYNGDNIKAALMGGTVDCFRQYELAEDKKEEITIDYVIKQFDEVCDGNKDCDSCKYSLENDEVSCTLQFVFDKYNVTGK